MSVWDATTGEAIVTFRGHKGKINALAFAADNATLASAADDRTVRLWHMPTHRNLGVLHRGQLFTLLEFADDGSTLLADSQYSQRRLFLGPSPP